MRDISKLLQEAHERNIASALAFASPHQSFHAGMSTKAMLYDLASLTKIVGTTLALAKAHVDGSISFDEIPFKSWPHIRVRDLMSHRSGLKAHVKFYEHDISKNNFNKNYKLIFEILFRQQPVFKPNSVRVYSDLNFLALGYLLEQRLKKPLFTIFEQSWTAFKLPPLRYFPSGQEPRSLSPVATTGYCPIRGILKAQVHDLNAYYLGGLAAHAGLFANLKEIIIYGNFFLRAFKDKSNAYESCLAYCARNFLGFDKTSPKGSVQSLSPPSFGHFGFTGVSLWIDPWALSYSKERGLFIALLTNRVAKNLDSNGIFWLRRKAHQLLLQ
jgi:CubicO group peptidase (beta-lactamase class C family)